MLLANWQGRGDKSRRRSRSRSEDRQPRGGNRSRDHGRDGDRRRRDDDRGGRDSRESRDSRGRDGDRGHRSQEMEESDARKKAAAAKAAADAATELKERNSYLDFDDSEEEGVGGSGLLTGGLKFEKTAAEKAAEMAFDDHCAWLVQPPPPLACQPYCCSAPACSAALTPATTTSPLHSCSPASISFVLLSEHGPARACAYHSADTTDDPLAGQDKLADGDKRKAQWRARLGGGASDKTAAKW